MREIEQIGDLRETVTQWRDTGERIALVPTMGNLHAGHLALVARARELADRVVVSIFVNPTQFGPDDDFAEYPRTPERDRSKLVDAGVDLLFSPDVDTMYPEEPGTAAVVQLPGLDNILEGAERPGHFAGVATVVSKLFNLVTPDVAVFGRKDYQQLAVIRRMAASLAFPIEIAGAETGREADGLALSSRNRYLSTAERDKAPALYRTLSAVAKRLQQGERDFSALEVDAAERLKAAGFQPDYVAVRRPETLATPVAGDNRFVVLGAAWLGGARLIDNVSVVDA